MCQKGLLAYYVKNIRLAGIW